MAVIFNGRDVSTSNGHYMEATFSISCSDSESLSEASDRIINLIMEMQHGSATTTQEEDIDQHISQYGLPRRSPNELMEYWGKALWDDHGIRGVVTEVVDEEKIEEPEGYVPEESLDIEL